MRTYETMRADEVKVGMVDQAGNRVVDVRSGHRVAGAGTVVLGYVEPGDAEVPSFSVLPAEYRVSFWVPERFAVCGECATGLANDDWSFVDHYCDTPEQSAEDHAAIAASVEVMGDVAFTGETGDGYGRCFVCGSDAIGCLIYEQV